MILTFKIAHGRDFTRELRAAREVAEYAIQNRDALSTKYVKHLGLPAAISNQILRKYGRNKKCHKISRASLILPGEASRHEEAGIRIPCLKLTLPAPRRGFTKVNQIELDKTHAFISVTVEELEEREVEDFIGVDVNATGHLAVMADPVTGKVKKFGKNAAHTRVKYNNLGAKAQSKRQYRKNKRLRNREARIIKDLNNKISREIVNFAAENRKGIRLEKLTNIRKRAKSAKRFRYSLHSWSFFDLQQMIEYKAKLLGIPVQYINPEFTSQNCSRCGLLGKRNRKNFTCPRAECEHVDNADTNAAFNIANRSTDYQSARGRDCVEGPTDVPQGALV